MKELELKVVEMLKQRSLVSAHRSWGVFTVVNSIKVEWCTRLNTLALGVDNSEADRTAIYNALIVHYPNDLKCFKNYISVYQKQNLTLDDYSKLLDVCLSLDLNLECPFIHSEKRGSVDFTTNSIFLKLAKTVRFAVDNELPQILSRGSSIMDCIDDIITVGESTNRTVDNSYREHIVPCDLIIREAVEMVRDGRKDYEIATMIQQNLFIVLITPEEAKKLDVDMGLKCTMPDDWVFGDDPFARLSAAEIILK